MIARKMRVDPVMIAIPLIMTAVFIVCCSLNNQAMPRIVGVIYPVLKTSHCLVKSEYRFERDLYRQWMTYWSIYGLFLIIDEISEIMTSSGQISPITKIIPFYNILKLGIFIWLSNPST